MNADGQLFNLATTFQDLTSPVTCLAWSAEEKFLIAGDAVGNLDFRDPVSGKIIRSEKAFNSPVAHISFNSTGRLMIVSAHDGEIKIYDFVKAKFIQSLYSPDYAGIRFALFSIADGFIYFNGQGRLYKTRSDLTQPVEKIYECDSVLTDAVITEDRNAFIFSCGNAVKVLNTRTDHVVQEFITSPANIERLALTGNKLVSWSNDGTMIFRNYELNQVGADPLLWFKAGTCSKLAFSRDGNLMVTGNTGTWARIWKPIEREVVQELFGHKEKVTNFVFSDDDQTLFSAGNDKTIHVWKQKLEEQKTKPVVIASEIVRDTVIQPAGIVAGDSSLPAIELNFENIPAHVGGRKVEKTSVVEVSDSTIDIYVFDNSTLDGDIMSLSFQNQWLLTHYEVTKQKKKITLRLNPGSNNYLVLFADNLGKTPPNTAAISFDSKGRERIFKLESDLKTCSAINFIYKSR